MKPEPFAASVRGLVLLAALALVAPACSSRPVGGDGGDAGAGGAAAGSGGTAGGAGRGGAGGAAGNAGANGGAGSGGASGEAGSGGSGRGGNGAAGTTGAAGSGGAAGTAGTAGSAGASGGAGGRGGGGGTAAGGRGGASGGSGGASGGRGGSGGASGGKGGSGGASGGKGGGGGGASGGKGGAGGVPSPECTTASDCVLFTDCCRCEAVPVGTTVETCPAICIQSACQARMLPANSVACVAGRCVAGFACDTTRVTCRIATPSCPAGEVPTVNDAGTCYLGTCAPATECTTVTSCGACTGAGEVCVSYETQLGPQYHCVTIPPACNGNGGCSCNGLVSCVAPYRMCTDYSGIRGVSCSCPTC